MEKYQLENNTILNFPTTKTIKNSADLLSYDCDILIPAALENVVSLDNADSIKAKIICEAANGRSEEHTSELQSRRNLVCRLLLEKKKKKNINNIS